MRNALSGRISTRCGVLQDGLLEFTAVQHVLCKPECSHYSELSSDSICQEDTAGSILFSHPSFHSLFLALCFVFCQAESAVVGKFSCCFVLLPPRPPCLPVVCAQPVLHCGFALTDLQPQFMRILVWELPANSLLSVVNIHGSIFGWHDWSMR